jgi:peptide chain release factor 1
MEPNSHQALLETKTYLNDPDPTMRDLALEEQSAQLTTLQTLLRSFPPLLLPPSTTGSYNALIELKSGVGGAESSLFLTDLLRMYVRFAESRGWRTKVSMGSGAEGGGVKEASVEVRSGSGGAGGWEDGEGAYEMLRWESGVHRVQRVPATESSGRVHTSTAVVIVRP